MSTFSFWTGDVASAYPLHHGTVNACIQVRSDLVQDADIRQMAQERLADARKTNPAFANAELHDGGCKAGGFDQRVMHRDVQFQGHDVSISAWI